MKLRVSAFSKEKALVVAFFRHVLIPLTALNHRWPTLNLNSSQSSLSWHFSLQLSQVSTSQPRTFSNVFISLTLPTRHPDNIIHVRGAYKHYTNLVRKVFYSPSWYMVSSQCFGSGLAPSTFSNPKFNIMFICV